MPSLTTATPATAVPWCVSTFRIYLACEHSEEAPHVGLGQVSK